jgi:hypothetical protein
LKSETTIGPWSKYLSEKCVEDHAGARRVGSRDSNTKCKKGKKKRRCMEGEIKEGKGHDKAGYAGVKADRQNLQMCSK